MKYKSGQNQTEDKPTSTTTNNNNNNNLTETNISHNPYTNGHLPQDGGGWISWMVHNRVTPNLLMLILIFGGLYASTKIKKEVFPEFSTDSVDVSVSYNGSSPEQIEEGIVLAIEEAIRSVEGIEEINSTASEGRGSVVAELLPGYDPQRAYQDIQQEVDRITTFPDDAEEPELSISSRRQDVIDIRIYGDASKWALRELGEQARDRLLQESQITVVEFNNARDYEVLVEVSEHSLRAYNLTLNQIANLIQNTALDLPAGTVRTQSGQILLRFTERKDWAQEFAQIPIVTDANGSVLYLSDIADIIDGFEESDRESFYNGQHSIGLEVYRVGDQTPIEVVDAARQAMHDFAAHLPDGVEYAMLNDNSQMYRQRMELLFRNGFLGLVLVLVLLSIFLEFKLAMWVVLGIPTSFLGAILFLPFFDVSINMISMFAFIIALGIVVDDAIVAGESIYEHRLKGESLVHAAIAGAKEVAVPITFSILTNIAAFFPLMFVPGFMGKIWFVIPVVVSTVFLISLVEALVILPAHLAHTSSEPKNPIGRLIHNSQQAFTQRFTRFVQTVYGPILALSMRWRFLTLSACLTLLIYILAFSASGRIGFDFMPRTEGDRSDVTITLPLGSPMSDMRRVHDQLVKAAQKTIDEHGGQTLAEGIYSRINSNTVRATIYLQDAESRPLGTRQVTQLWRENTGKISGADNTFFQSDRGGPGSGRGLSFQLSHRNIQTLNRAASALAQELEQFSQTSDIDAGFQLGKKQYDFQLTERGRSLGLTTQDVARQVRAAFLGTEAFRQQRGRNEITVRVRKTENERQSDFDIHALMIRTQSGTDVPLREIATIDQGRAYTTINRQDGRRSVTVSCNVNPQDQVSIIKHTFEQEILPKLQSQYPGLTITYDGRQQEQQESMQALKQNFLIALIVIYLLLAIPFKSYLQPIIVMTAIPFGIVGAILGHMVMGFGLSVISIMGIIALSGVVVNDSLVMIDYANRRRLEGFSPWQAIHASGIRRFRPILLTTITTFGGLAPMIFETSRQARFMVPMAISLGFGILFSTAILLLLVPSLYLILEDVKVFYQRLSKTKI